MTDCQYAAVEMSGKTFEPPLENYVLMGLIVVHVWKLCLDVIRKNNKCETHKLCLCCVQPVTPLCFSDVFGFALDGFSQGLLPKQHPCLFLKGRKDIKTYDSWSIDLLECTSTSQIRLNPFHHVVPFLKIVAKLFKSRFKALPLP